MNNLARRAFRVLVPLSLLLQRAPHAEAGDPRSLEVVTAPGSITVQTSEWRLVFDEAFNGGPAGWFDRGSDPGELDNLASEQGGSYSQGAIFDYDVYLGTNGGNAIEYMTTMGRNAAPGSLELTLLEATPARVRIRQQGHPRLNNGAGPPGDPFSELPQLGFTTTWTLYPTGKIHIDFETELDAGGIVDSGPGTTGRSVAASGSTVTATGGTDFAAAGVWAGDTIESSSGAWGPVLVTARTSGTTLSLAAAVPTGANLDFVIRRPNVVMETISIHADGDAALVNQCAAPVESTWQGGSNGDAIWSVPDNSACRSLLRQQGGGLPPLAEDTLLVHWALGRAAGSLLAFFEPWPEASFGAFNDQGFTDISYTQLGRFGVRPMTAQHRHFLAQIGSTVAPGLPDIQSVAAAQAQWRDYRAPWAEALAGTLASGADITPQGFDLAAGAYRLAAEPCTPVDTCRVAAIRFDGSAIPRAGAYYITPAVELEGFDYALAAGDHDVRVDVSSDGGSSYNPLDPSLYNLSSAEDEVQLGAGRRVFQHLRNVGGETILRFKASSQCSATPRAGCRSSRRARLTLSPGGAPSRRQLRWSWVGGPATQQDDFGDPTAGSDTSLCIYDTNGLILEASVAAAETCSTRPCWSAIGSRGYRYRRPDGNGDGVRSLRMLGGDLDQPRVRIHAKGENLVLPSLPIANGADLVVQLGNSASATCWESSFPPADFVRNSPDGFTAAQP